MRFVGFGSLVAAAVIAASACGDGSTGPGESLVIKTAPQFAATVDKSTLESGNGPNGPYSQYDLWVIVLPGIAANAGVVVPASVPVFLRHDGRLDASAASVIHKNDKIEVWREPQVVTGAVQAPPGAPLYVATQVVIGR